MAQADTFRCDNAPSQGCHRHSACDSSPGKQSWRVGKAPSGEGKQDGRSRWGGTFHGESKEDGWRYFPGTMPLHGASIYLLHPSSPDHRGEHGSATQVPNPAGTPGEHSCWTGRAGSRRTGHASRSSRIPAAPQQGGGSLLLCRALLFSISPNQGMTWQTGSIPSEHWVRHAPASTAAPSTQGPSGGERDGRDCGAPPPLKMPPTSSQHSEQPYLRLTQPGPAGWRREMREGKQLETQPQCYLPMAGAVAPRWGQNVGLPQHSKQGCGSAKSTLLFSHPRASATLGSATGKGQMLSDVTAATQGEAASPTQEEQGRKENHSPRRAQCPLPPALGPGATGNPVPRGWSQSVPELLAQGVLQHPPGRPGQLPQGRGTQEDGQGLTLSLSTGVGKALAPLGVVSRARCPPASPTPAGLPCDPQPPNPTASPCPAPPRPHTSPPCPPPHPRPFSTHPRRPPPLRPPRTPHPRTPRARTTPQPHPSLSRISPSSVPGRTPLTIRPLRTGSSLPLPCMPGTARPGPPGYPPPRSIAARPGPPGTPGPAGTAAFGCHRKCRHGNRDRSRGERSRPPSLRRRR